MRFMRRVLYAIFFLSLRLSVWELFFFAAISHQHERSVKNGFIAFNVNIFMQRERVDIEDMSIMLKPQSNAFMCYISHMLFFLPSDFFPHKPSEISSF